jgi:general secretion pathway protein F
MIGVTVILVLTVVLPRFKSLFAESQASLPWITRAVLALGDFINDYGLYCAFLVVLLVLVVVKIWRDPARAEEMDRRLLQSRWTFGLIAKAQTARYLRTLGTLARSGVPLPDATQVALGMLHNRALAAAGRAVHTGLRQGASFSALLHRAALFPPAAVQLARVGEETGRLEDLLIEAADTLDREAQGTLDRLLSVFVPLTTIVMGALVAGLIASILVGILSLNDLAY